MKNHRIFFMFLSVEQNNSKYTFITKFSIKGFPGDPVVKNPPANAGDMGSSPGPGRSHMPRSN